MWYMGKFPLLKKPQVLVICPIYWGAFEKKIFGQGVHKNIFLQNP